MTEIAELTPGMPTPDPSDRLGEHAITLTQEWPNDREAILSGVMAVAETITDHYPQVDPEGKLSYYIAGSLATMLLAQASHIEQLDWSVLPAINPTSRIAIPPEASSILQKMARQMGDIDIATLPGYDERADADVSASPGSYEEARRRWVTYGVKVTFPQAAEPAIRSARTDVVADQRPARIEVGGQEFYIPDPKVMLEYKAIHLVFDFARYPDKEKLVTDFAALAEGLSLIYPREELVGIIYGTLKTDPNIVLPTYDHRLDEVGRAFLQEAVAIDENAAYLEHLQTGPERAMGVLNILREYESPAAKQAIVEFINKNWQQLDHWQVVANDPSNYEIVLNYISENVALTELENYDPEIDGSLENWLKNSSWAVRKYGEAMPPGSGLVYEPVESDFLSLLAELDESHITQELAVIDKAVAIPSRYPDFPRGEDLKRILESPAAKNPTYRRALFGGIGTALTQFDQGRAQDFLEALNSASRDIQPDDTEASPEERFAAIDRCFSAFSLRLTNLEPLQ